jgi:hypothetical protein
MSDRSPSPSVRVRRFRVAVAAAVAGLVAIVGGVAWGVSQAPDGGGDTTSAAADSARAAPSSEAAEASVSEASTASLSPAVADQLDYVREHWRDTSSEQFGYLDENDCVNFASQSLLARGWAVDDEWWYDESGDGYSSAPAWVSSTALRDYLEEHPERGATALTDDQRAQVKPGDLVQFDWDDSGDRDHTGIVTSAVTAADGSVTIRYAGHTDATWDRTVDYAITELHPGGVAYYWSIPE